jgi:hypothetical protein
VLMQVQAGIQSSGACQGQLLVGRQGRRQEGWLSVAQLTSRSAWPHLVRWAKDLRQVALQGLEHCMRQRPPTLLVLDSRPHMKPWHWLLRCCISSAKAVLAPHAATSATASGSAGCAAGQSRPGVLAHGAMGSRDGVRWMLYVTELSILYITAGGPAVSSAC